MRVRKEEKRRKLSWFILLAKRKASYPPRLVRSGFHLFRLAAVNPLSREDAHATISVVCQVVPPSYLLRSSQSLFFFLWRFIKSFQVYSVGRESQNAQSHLDSSSQVFPLPPPFFYHHINSEAYYPSLVLFRT